MATESTFWDMFKDQPQSWFTTEEIQMWADGRAARADTRGDLLKDFPPEGPGDQPDRIRAKWIKDNSLDKPLTDLDREMLGYLWLIRFGKMPGFKEEWWMDAPLPKVPTINQITFGGGALIGAAAVLGGLVLLSRLK